MVTRDVFVPLDDKGCHSERSEESGEKAGTTDREQGYFAFCCISMNYKKLMFTVPLPVPDFVNAYPKSRQRTEVRYVDAVS